MVCKRGVLLVSLGFLLTQHLCPAWSLALVWEYTAPEPPTGFIITAVHAAQPKPSTYRILPDAATFAAASGVPSLDSYCADVGPLPPGRYTLSVQAEHGPALSASSPPITCTMEPNGTCPDAPTVLGTCADSGARPTPLPAESPLTEDPPPEAPPSPPPVAAVPAPLPAESPAPAEGPLTEAPSSTPVPIALPAPPQPPAPEPSPDLEPEPTEQRMRTKLAQILTTYAETQRQLLATYASELRQAQTLPTARERNTARRTAHQTVTTGLWTSFGEAAQSFFGVVADWLSTVFTRGAMSEG